MDDTSEFIDLQHPAKKKKWASDWTRLFPRSHPMACWGHGAVGACCGRPFHAM